MVNVELLNKEELTNLIYGKSGVPILKDLEKRIRFFNYHEDLINPPKTGEVCFVTLFDNKKIIGLIKLYKSPYVENTFWINYFSIDENYRDFKYSLLMMKKMFEFAKERNIDLESSGYTSMGWDRVREKLHEMSEEYGVTLIDNRNRPEFENKIIKFSDFNKTNENVNNDFINKQILDYCEKNNIEVRELDGEKYIHLYHGTNMSNYKKILKSGKFLSGTWFAGDLETAKQYGNMATSKGESVVLTQYININSLYFNGYFIAKHDLKMNYKYGSGGNVYESVNENIKADMKLPQDILTFYELFKKANKDLFLVGGSVRDFIMGKTPHDFDLVTNALPDETKEILKDYRTDLQGVHFGVIRVFTENEPLGYEVASYRKDLVTGRDTKGDDQKVEIGKHITIKDDVLRRDYSCNALFYDIGKKEIIDLVGGIEDIKNNIIRAVGNPEERFKEDKLRIIRGIRFAARTHSKIDEETANAIRKDKRLRGISPKDDVSQERIIKEIKDTWGYCNTKNDLKAWQTYFKLLNEFDLLEEMFPNVKLNKDVEYIETLNLPITYATLFEDNEPTPVFEKTLIRIFKLSNKISDIIMFLLTFIRDAGDVEKVYMLKKKQMQYNISDDIIREYSYMNGIGKRFTDKFLEYQLTVSGEDVMSDGFKGSEIGIEQKRREIEIFNNLLNENYNF